MATLTTQPLLSILNYLQILQKKCQPPLFIYAGSAQVNRLGQDHVHLAMFALNTLVNGPSSHIDLWIEM